MRAKSPSERWTTVAPDRFPVALSSTADGRIWQGAPGTLSRRARESFSSRTKLGVGLGTGLVDSRELLADTEPDALSRFRRRHQFSNGVEHDAELRVVFFERIQFLG